jgi:hypothetical protein
MFEEVKRIEEFAFAVRNTGTHTQAYVLDTPQSVI